MTRNELIAAVALDFMKDKLESEPDGTQRICILGLDAEVVRAIASAVLADAVVSATTLVRISSVFDPEDQLPDDARSDEAITHWRHCKLPSAKRAVLFGATQAELQRNDKSVEKITKIESDTLRERYEAWIECVGLSDIHLGAAQRAHLKAALKAANESHAARTISSFADFVLQVASAVMKGGLPLQKAIDNALPALRLPRYSAYFDRIPESLRDNSAEWAKYFRKVNARIRPLLVRENERGEPIDDQLAENLAAVANRFSNTEIDTLNRFLNDDLSADGWSQSQVDLVDMDWRTISEVFEGLSKTESLPLGERTIKFFQDEFDDGLEDEDRALLSADLPKEPSEEARSFFEVHQEHIARDKKLYATWEKYVYNNPQPYSDFLVELVATLHRLRERTNDDELTERKLLIRIPRGREKSFWRGKNASVAKFFAFRYRGLSALLGKNVIVDFGKIDEFYFPETDSELSKSTSGARDARSLKFEVVLDPEGVKSKLLFVWEMPVDALATAMPEDLLRIANKSGDKALLPTADITRQSTSAKGRIQRIDLSDVNTIRDVANSNNGTMVAPNQESGDRSAAFIGELEKLSSVLPSGARSAIGDAFEGFNSAYSQAIREWVKKDGPGISSSLFIEQATAFGKLLVC